jgi:hypothetical protein
MSELGQLLELLHDAHRRLGTFEGEYRDWTRPRPSLEVIIERSEVDGRQRMQWRGAGPFPVATATERRIWLQRPDSLRIEIVSGTKLVRFGVLTQARWWRWDAVHGSDMGTAPVDASDGWSVPPLLSPPLLEPVRLLAPLRLQPSGRGTRAGREVVCARGSPRQPARTAQALAFELEFDAQHGTMLRCAALEKDQLVSVSEAVEVRYGSHVDKQRFVFVSPDGKPARPLQTAANLPEAGPAAENLENVPANGDARPDQPASNPSAIGAEYDQPEI